MPPERKEKSHARIVEAASRRFRAAGLDGAGVAEIMAAAGLTHGGFYAHFADKDALIAAALTAAMDQGRAAWLGDLAELPPAEAHRTIVGRYLSRGHRDAPSDGCPMAALASELARRDEATRAAFENTFLATLAALERLMPASDGLDRRARATATVALCLGGLLLSRMVAQRELSDAILFACRRALTVGGLPPEPRSG